MTDGFQFKGYIFSLTEWSSDYFEMSGVGGFT
jgi:hypothetical protein